MGIVEEYKSWFEAIFALIGDTAEEVLLSAFMNDLKKEIRAKVKVFFPMTLKEVMLRMQEIEGKNYVIDVQLKLT